MKNKHAVLSLSGGMDSSTLLLHLLSEGYQVTALSFDYGQKHKVELERASELVEYINSKELSWEERVQFLTKEQKIEYGYLSPFTDKIINYAFNSWEIPKNYNVKHQIIKLDGLSQLLNSSLVEGGSEVPEGHYADENMKDTVVPNRNKIFSSIIQAVALSIADKNDAECVIAMGIHAGDHAIYPDCRQEFRDIDFAAFQAGNWGAEKVQIYTPYLDTDKFGILEDGVKQCVRLGLNVDEVYKRTNTSYKPICIPKIHSVAVLEDGTREILTENIWYSDYKSASSVERIEAFIKLDYPDPVEYADETGPVSWNVAKEYVQGVLDNYAGDK